MGNAFELLAHLMDFMTFGSYPVGLIKALPQLDLGRGQQKRFRIRFRIRLPTNHPWLGCVQNGMQMALPWLTFLSLCRVNVGCGPAEERVLLTGLHAVADIYCENCKTTLGWKYVSTSLFLSMRRRCVAPVAGWDLLAL